MALSVRLGETGSEQEEHGGRVAVENSKATEPESSNLLICESNQERFPS